MATATDHFYEQLTEIRRAGFRLWLDDQGYAFHRPESLEAILYRIKSGGIVRPLEPRENWYQLV